MARFLLNSPIVSYFIKICICAPVGYKSDQVCIKSIKNNMFGRI